MSVLDLALLSLAIATGLILIFGWPGTRARLIIFVSLIVLAAAQLFIEGFYWHFVPTYLLIIAIGISIVRTGHGAGFRAGLGKWAARFGFLALSGIAGIAFMVLPAPNLPIPTGPYLIGTDIFRWVDEARDEPAVPDEKRNVIVQAWYPAETGQGGTKLPYMDGLGRLPSSISLLPREIMVHYDQIDTHAVANVPVSKAKTEWPIILFSPGYGAPRAFYTSLVSELASRGYVVLAVDHPYEVGVTELADGRIAVPELSRKLTDEGWNRYMTDMQSLRAEDMRFVFDQLAKPGILSGPLAGHIDLDKVAAIGHSFGGASAAELASQDIRVKAVANIDGTPYGDLPNKSLSQPFMLIQSDQVETGHSEKFLKGNESLIKNLAGTTGLKFEILKANHYSFTDAPLFFAAPARFALEQVIGGSRGVKTTVLITTDLLEAFLSVPFGDEKIDVISVANSHGLVAGGVGH